MSRFDLDDGEGLPWELWEQIVSRALGGRRGQEALSALEEALVALPEPRLIDGHLAADGAVCAVGAYVAYRRAQEVGVDIASVVDAMAVGVRCSCGHARDQHREKCLGPGWQGKPCWCDEYKPEESDIYDTTDAGQNAGLSHVIAWHLAYLNDEQFGGLSPEDRYDRVLTWTRRALGKVAA
jgi:hypothetical protein